jgi:hypothetical protein
MTIVITKGDNPGNYIYVDVVKQYDFLLGAALFLWQQLMALMGW